MNKFKDMQDSNISNWRFTKNNHHPKRVNFSNGGRQLFYLEQLLLHRLSMVRTLKYEKLGQHYVWQCVNLSP